MSNINQMLRRVATRSSLVSVCAAHSRNTAASWGLLGVALAALGGCASTDELGVGQHSEPVTRYIGTLPCDDCREIRADLTLHRDPDDGHPMNYVLQQTHVDAIGGDFTSTLWGNWEQAVSGEQRFYRFDGKLQPFILRLDDDGQRLSWVDTVQDSSGGSDIKTYELKRAEPLY
uniref:copper resistance protein NlpE N-terminal domain-containing protein n=1 Tax=Halomonas sp. TaxID=1486246 RepID=UPI00262196A0|nr:copper resistance protein NlpE N-terminal domain-containing protein [Halomonas sp.]